MTLIYKVIKYPVQTSKKKFKKNPETGENAREMEKDTQTILTQK